LEQNCGKEELWWMDHYLSLSITPDPILDNALQMLSPPAGSI
jgi:hypothetical protein